MALCINTFSSLAKRSQYAVLPKTCGLKPTRMAALDDPIITGDGASSGGHPLHCAGQVSIGREERARCPGDPRIRRPIPVRFSTSHFHLGRLPDNFARKRDLVLDRTDVLLLLPFRVALLERARGRAPGKFRILTTAARRKVKASAPPTSTPCARTGMGSSRSRNPHRRAPGRSSGAPPRPRIDPLAGCPVCFAPRHCVAPRRKGRS